MIKEIENHSGYVASDQGLIFRKTKDGLRELKPSIVGKYPVVQLGRRTYYVHRIIANLFVPNDDPIGRPLIFHIDGDPSNNSSSNLVWLSRKEISICSAWLPEYRVHNLRQRASYHSII
jgi:hypothetical protein